MPFSWLTNRGTAGQGAADERRRTLRIQLSLEGEFLFPDGKKAPCTICDLSIRGAEARVHEIDSELLTEGTTCELKVTGPRREWHVCTPVVLRSRKKSDPGWFRIGAEFEKLGDRYGQMETCMAPYFNRRKSRRVNVPVDQGLSVQMGRGRERTSARVRDISSGGVSVTLAKVQALPFVLHAEIEVSMTLPGSKKEMNGKAVIRHIEAVDKMSILGLEFDLSAKDGFSRHSRAIGRFVRRMERSMRRVLRSVRT
jgi:hypothetical protein